MTRTAQPAAKTTLDDVAEGYWQDFLAKNPIAGGIYYEEALYECDLDASLDSLQRIDSLLSTIRRDLIKADKWDESAILADAKYRHLLLFLAFYSGRVLMQHGRCVGHWLNKAELRARAPHVTIDSDDFYQRMALSYSKPLKDAQNKLALFFALEPIGMRLFAHIDRPFVGVGGGQVPSGLYQAVSSRLQHLHENFDSQNHSQDNSQNSSQKNLPTETSLQDTTDKGADNKKAADKKAVDQDIAHKESVFKKTTHKETAYENDTYHKEDDHKKTATQISAPKSQEPPTPEVFTKLLDDLATIEVPQRAGQREYQRAIHILDQFERHIARQDKPRAEVRFSQAHQNARQKALHLLAQASCEGNTAAMLRLAMYKWLDETDQLPDQAAIDLVKQAAGEDSRAQRLLSRLYYQGVYVPQDLTQGRYWLEQAAANGHKEAATLVNEWRRAETLITTNQQEQHSIKRYQLLIGAIIVAAILLFILV